MCKTDLNCRIDNGEDMFPEIIHKKIPIKPIVVRALDIIDVDEYDFINSANDIVIDLKLTPEEKEEVFQEILRRKNMNGGKRKHTKRFKQRRIATRRSKRRSKRSKK